MELILVVLLLVSIMLTEGPVDLIKQEEFTMLYVQRVVGMILDSQQLQVLGRHKTRVQIAT